MKIKFKKIKWKQKLLKNTNFLNNQNYIIALKNREIVFNIKNNKNTNQNILFNIYVFIFIILFIRFVSFLLTWNLMSILYELLIIILFLWTYIFINNLIKNHKTSWVNSSYSIFKIKPDNKINPKLDIKNYLYIKNNEK